MTATAPTSSSRLVRDTHHPIANSNQSQQKDSDILRSSGNIAKVLGAAASAGHQRGHSPPTRDGEVSQSSESAISAKDIINKHQANISRLAQAFGMMTKPIPSPSTSGKKRSGGGKFNPDLDDLGSINETPTSKELLKSA